MTLTLTYESQLSRVNVTATGLGSRTAAVVERSVDQVTWSTVRCAAASPIVSGAITVYDYEFSSGVPNYYRVTSPSDVTLVGVGAAAHADNASVTPAMPVGVQAGDLVMVLGAIRGTGAFVTGSGWSFTVFPTEPNVRLFAKIAGAGEPAPTVSFALGAAGDTTSAQVVAFRGNFTTVTDLVVNNAGQSNASAQNVAYPALTVTRDDLLILYYGWKQDDWTSTTPPGTKIGDPSSTVGSDQGIVWSFQQQFTKTNISAGSITVTGGASAVSKAAVLSLRPGNVVQTGVITPTITDVWLKSIGKPFLNRTFTCVPPATPIEREARNQVFEIIGRSYPIALTDLRQSYEVSIDVITSTTTQWRELDLILSAGDPMFVHTPLDYPLPSMYVVINRTSMRRPLLRPTCNDNDYRITTLPLRQVAAPGPDVCSSTITWQGVINAYATWQAVLNVETTWLDLMTNIGSPADVIVP